MKNINEMSIAICSDHAGFELKETVKAYLAAQVKALKDFGTNSTASCDYADFAHPMASAVESGEFDFGISILDSSSVSKFFAIDDW